MQPQADVPNDGGADGGDDGVELAYHRPDGRGPVVVLCHGITDSGPCWSRVADRLRERYDVVLPDARGHGRSPHPDTYAFSAHVRDLERLLDHLAAAPVVLVGHSMAGPHVTAVAARRPELVRALVVEDPHWPLEPEDPDAYDLEGWSRTIATNSRRPVTDLLEEGRRSHPGWHDDDLRPWAEAAATVDPRVPTWLRSPEIAGWRDDLGGVGCPVLLLTGDQDVTVTPEVAAAAAATCPTLEQAHLDGAGHSVRRDRFEAYTAALVSFLDRVHGAGS